MRSAIATFYTRAGKTRFVVEDPKYRPTKYPFRQMDVGDWFEVYSDEEIGGNLTSLASLWGIRLRRKFQTRTVGMGRDQKIRVTRIK